MRIDLLDHGYVELMSHTPDGDLLVVNAARCSFDKEHKNFDQERDTGLVRFLAREGHVLPFRHVNTTLRIHAPIYVLRQLGKHQVGFSWSEVSRRYITGDPEFHIPTLRKKAKNVKQGSSTESISAGSIYESLMSDAYSACMTLYKRLLEKDVAPEQARMVLPQAMYTTTVTTGTLLGWHHMHTLRTEEHTQRETQEYAKAIGTIMSQLYPVSWEALCFETD